MADAAPGYSFRPWQRLFLGTGGLVLVAAGGMAVFQTDNGTGSAALIIGGLALMTLALIGRLSEIRWGSAGAMFDPVAVQEVRRVGDELRELAVDRDHRDDAGAQAMLVAAERLQEVIESAFGRVTAVQAPEGPSHGHPKEPRTLQDAVNRAERFEVAALEAVARIVADQPELEVEVRAPAAGPDPDGTLRTPRGDVLIEAKYLQPGSAVNVPRLRTGADWLETRAAMAKRAAIGLIIVPSGSLSPRELHAARRLVDAHGSVIGLVEWSPGDDAGLSNALRERIKALERATPEG